MKVHANAALGPAGRIALCELVDRGQTLRAAAAALNVAPATAHRWWHRRQMATAEELRSGAWLRDRSSRPRRQPRRMGAAQEEPILRARRETGLGPGRLAGIVRRARSTVWKVLRRNGVSRHPARPRESIRRYEWSRPGALLHVDTTRLPRFQRPGHRVRGRSTESRRGRPELGYAFLHACVDDRSRYAYVEQHPDERAETAAAFMRRAIERFSGLGLGPPEAVMSDKRQPLPLLRLSRRARAGRRPPDPHPALHAALERQGRALLSDAQEGVGLRPLLAELSAALAGAGILHPLLQPATPPQLAWRPAADQPRSQRPWAGQLGRTRARYSRSPAASHSRRAHVGRVTQEPHTTCGRASCSSWLGADYRRLRRRAGSSSPSALICSVASRFASRSCSGGAPARCAVLIPCRSAAFDLFSAVASVFFAAFVVSSRA